MTEFFNCWGKIKCSVTGQLLFSAETWKKTEAVLHDVCKGWLSDPTSIPVYTREGTDKNGLPLYHCIHGTNSVEGTIHNPIRRNFASLNASPELADALIADFQHVITQIQVHSIKQEFSIVDIMILGRYTSYMKTFIG